MSKHSKKKHRNQRIGVSTRDEVDSFTFSINQQTGEIRFETPVINGYVEVAYDRLKGEKIVSRFHLPPENLDPNPDHAASSNFDIVFAVDTNTWVVEDRPVSVTALIEAHKVFIPAHEGSVELAWRYHTAKCFAFAGPRDKPERAGWALAIEFIHNSPQYQKIDRVGIVVDSDLGDLRACNERRSPIAGDIYLPTRMSLLYASADTGGEYFANQLLRRADREATFCLEKIKDGTIAMPDRQLPGVPFQRLLYIAPVPLSLGSEARG